jgi:hypothetical protein
MKRPWKRFSSASSKNLNLASKRREIARRRDFFLQLERWAKLIGGAITVATFLLAVITYSSESGVRTFSQKQEAWSIINDHARDYACDWDERDNKVPRYHTNNGQVEALQFLIKQGTWLSGIGMPCSEFGHLMAKGAHLNNTNFWLSNFTMADFRGAELASIDLNRSSLDAADFSDATLKNAQMHGVSAKSAIFSRAILSFVRMPGSDLTCSDFRGADLSGANLNGSRVSSANFNGAIFNEATTYDGACWDVPSKKDKCDGDGKPVGWPGRSLERCSSKWSRQLNDND